MVVQGTGQQYGHQKREGGSAPKMFSRHGEAVQMGKGQNEEAHMALCLKWDKNKLLLKQTRLPLWTVI